MTLYASIMREIAANVGLPFLREVARQPGVKAAYRISLHYGDMRAHDAVCAVTIRTAQVNAVVQVYYVGRFDSKPILRGMPPDLFTGWAQALQAIKFDRMHDQDGIVPYGVDLCMVERASGGFEQGVIFMPKRADGAYATLLGAVRTYLPEVLREVT